MEAKQYIRTYEQLKNEKNKATLEEQLQLEKKWLHYYKEVDFVIRKMTKKQKTQLQPFKDKALRELKQVSTQLFFTLTKRKGNEFNRLFTKETSLFFKKGTAGLLPLIDLDFQAVREKIVQKEQNLSQSEQDWIIQVEHLLTLPYASLTEAYAIETELNQFFYWWSEKIEKTEKAKQYQSLYTTICRYHMDLINFVLKALGYTFSMDEVFVQKRQKNMLRLKGFIKTLQKLEKEKSVINPFLNQLQQNITFLHPRDEFASVRAQKRHFVLHIGPTNSGKTHHAIESLKAAPTGAYLAPIRLLALEIQEKLNANNVPCALLTGDEEVRTKGAKHVSSTIEMANFKQLLDVAVIDEIQMIQDPNRGCAWLRALFGLQAKEIHLCGAPHSVDFIINLINECGDSYEIHTYERQTELMVEQEAISFPHGAKKGDAFIVFSKRKVLETARELREAGYSVSIMYGKLPSETRRKQVELFATGENEIIVTTDAIGIGLNLPIQRVVFVESKKFDGKEERYLSTQEIKQIAGRAGRRGLYEKGYVNALEDKSYIEGKLQEIEHPITTSILAPTPKLTELKVGTLRQRFLAWNMAELQADYLEKADITKQLALLKHVEKWEHELSQELLFKTLYIPFDSENRQLLFSWIGYVKALKEGKQALQRPILTGKTNAHLEQYYHQLNLYQQFSKKFNLRYSSSWVREEKTKMAKMMNQSIRGVSNYRAI